MAVRLNQRRFILLPVTTSVSLLAEICLMPPVDVLTAADEQLLMRALIPAVDRYRRSKCDGGDMTRLLGESLALERVQDISVAYIFKKSNLSVFLALEPCTGASRLCGSSDGADGGGFGSASVESVLLSCSVTRVSTENGQSLAITQLLELARSHCSSLPDTVWATRSRRAASGGGAPCRGDAELNDTRSDIPSTSRNLQSAQSREAPSVLFRTWAGIPRKRQSPTSRRCDDSLTAAASQEAIAGSHLAEDQISGCSQLTPVSPSSSREEMQQLVPSEQERSSSGSIVSTSSERQYEPPVFEASPDRMNPPAQSSLSPELLKDGSFSCSTVSHVATPADMGAAMLSPQWRGRADLNSTAESELPDLAPCGDLPSRTAQQHGAGQRRSRRSEQPGPASSSFSSSAGGLTATSEASRLYGGSGDGARCKRSRVSSPDASSAVGAGVSSPLQICPLRCGCYRCAIYISSPSDDSADEFQLDRVRMRSMRVRPTRFAVGVQPPSLEDAGTGELFESTEEDLKPLVVHWKNRERTLKNLTCSELSWFLQMVRRDVKRIKLGELASYRHDIYNRGVKARLTLEYDSMPQAFTVEQATLTSKWIMYSLYGEAVHLDRDANDYALSVLTPEALGRVYQRFHHIPDLHQVWKTLRMVTRPRPPQ